MGAHRGPGAELGLHLALFGGVLVAGVLLNMGH